MTKKTKSHSRRKVDKQAKFLSQEMWYLISLSEEEVKFLDDILFSLSYDQNYMGYIQKHENFARSVLKKLARLRITPRKKRRV